VAASYYTFGMSTLDEYGKGSTLKYGSMPASLKKLKMHMDMDIRISCA
jgi:hypothetical protein